MTQEYLILFGAITDAAAAVSALMDHLKAHPEDTPTALASLDSLWCALLDAQIKAEAAYISAAD